MTIKRYAYSASGLDKHGQVWRATGKVECEFIDCLRFVVTDVLRQLAIRCDGINCVGPYEFRRIVIIKSKDQGGLS